MACHQLGLIDNVSPNAWVMHPLEPLTDSGKLPSRAVLVVVIVIVVELPCVLFGVKLTVTPVGWPEALNMMGALKPENWLMDMGMEVLRPCTTAGKLAARFKLKSPSMTSSTDVLRVTEPLAPEMMIGKVPAQALPLLVTFIVAVL